MPELPEVETIKLGLQKYLIGHVIKSVEVRLHRILTGDVSKITNAKITRVERFGKGLVIELNNNYSVAIHIKLTGQLIYQGPDIPKNSHPSDEKVGSLPSKFTHIIFHLDRSGVLYYNDIRQFGWIKILKTADIPTLPFFKDLGPEPFKDLNFEKFTKIISSVKTPVKVVLMDQKKIAGIGNIYANDSLYLAKTLPMRKANSLSLEEIKRLYESIEFVLKKGLKEGGASELTYVNALGEKGNYQNHFQIYAQNGKPCRNCGTTIKKTVLGGRGTYFCPICQK